MPGRLTGVGVGPGDPELVTLKALRALREAGLIFVPVAERGEEGRAETVVLAHVGPERVRRLAFSLSDDPAAREDGWAHAGTEVAAALLEHARVAFATIGDPNLYSTFTHLAQRVRSILPEAAIETVPGITAMQALAAASGAVLAKGAECLALLPFAAGENRLEEALASFDSVVCYKGGRHLPEILQAIEASGRLKGAVYGERLGLPGERVCPASETAGTRGAYLSTVIVPAGSSG